MPVTQLQWTRRVGMLFGVSVFLVSGCGGSEPKQAVQQTPPPAPMPVVKPAVSINALMVALVDHAGHVLWNIERDVLPRLTPTGGS